MDSLTGNSKIKNLFLIILLSILFTITAISLQHPITAQADMEAKQNSKSWSSNETDQSANDQAGYLYWAASSQRSGFMMYVSNNHGSTEWTKAFFDSSYYEENHMDYADITQYTDPQDGLRTCATQQIYIKNYTYLENASTVYYDDSWQSRGSEVADWLVSNYTEGEAEVTFTINGEVYAFQEWMNLIKEDAGIQGLIDVLQPLVDTVNDGDQAWHVFFEPISVDYLYTNKTFSSSTTDGYGRSYSAGDPIPSYTGDLNGEWYPTVYRCCSSQFLVNITQYVSNTGTGSYVYKFYNRQLPFSLCLEDEVILGRTDTNGDIYIAADLKECTRTLTSDSSDRITTKSDEWTGQYGTTLSGIGISSIDLTLFLTPIHTYDKDEGSPGDPEPTDDNTSGTCTIVKHYYKVTKTYDSDNNLTDVKYEPAGNSTGRYVRYQTTNYVVVMDETAVSGYQLIEWATSDNELTVDVPNQGEEGTIKFTNTDNSKDKGTKPKDDLYSQQDYINLILVNEEIEQVDDREDHFTITESTLTKRVLFSDIDLSSYNTNGKNLNEITFKWSREAFSITSCPGHSHKELKASNIARDTTTYSTSRGYTEEESEWKAVCGNTGADHLYCYSTSCNTLVFKCTGTGCTGGITYTHSATTATSACTGTIETYIKCDTYDTTSCLINSSGVHSASASDTDDNKHRGSATNSYIRKCTKCTLTESITHSVTGCTGTVTLQCSGKHQHNYSTTGKKSDGYTADTVKAAYNTAYGTYCNAVSVSAIAYNYYHTGTDYCTNSSGGSTAEWIDNQITLNVKNSAISNCNDDVVVTKSGKNKVVYYDNPSIAVKDQPLNVDSDINTLSKSITGLDYKCILWRGKDNVTIAKWKNNIGFLTKLRANNTGFRVANTPAGGRQTNNSYYTERFSAKFIGGGSDKSVSYGFINKPQCSVCGTITEDASGTTIDCTESRTYTCTTTVEYTNIKVDIYCYWGKQRGNSKPVANKKQVDAGSVTFYPYVEMKYDTLTGTDKPVYVVGEYQRTIYLLNYAEAVINSGNNTNTVKINSTQWSTHARTQSNLNTALGTSDKTYSILPGGATFSLSTPKDTLRTITATTYQCVLKDFSSNDDLKGKTQVTKTEGSSTLETVTEAKSYHNSFANNVANKVKTIKMAMFVDVVTATKPSVRIEKAGNTITVDGLTIKTSKNKKYYFNNFDGSKLDAEVGRAKYTYYTFRADTSGNIWMYTTNARGVVKSKDKILTKSQGVSSLSGTAYEINEKTKVVSQLVAALERNTGNDETARTGTKWYNEAFDGVTVLKGETTITLGYWNAAERSTVSDPKLMKGQSSQSDMGTQFLSAQFRTYTGTDLTAQFNNKFGSRTITILSKNDVEKLYKSEVFYIPNITTQDLN